MSQLKRWAPHVARVLLGLMFLVPGLNYFVPFLPPMEPPPDHVAPFMAGLMASTYIMPTVKTVEVLAGLALLANRFVPLALTLLAPIVVNIVFIHTLLLPSIGTVVVMLALELFLVWTHRDVFAPLFRAKHAPGHEPAASTEQGAVA